MLSQLAEAILPHPLSQRLWLHRHETLAAKQPSRWVEHAQRLSLEKFRSFSTPDGITVYTYNNHVLGEIHCDKAKKQTKNTLSDFFNAMRMVVEAYERMIAINDEHLQPGKVSTHPIVVLQPVEFEILENHPDFKLLVDDAFHNCWQEVSLVEVGNCVYRITVSDIEE